jgi:hypothetical protein
VCAARLLCPEGRDIVVIAAGRGTGAWRSRRLVALRCTHARCKGPALNIRNDKGQISEERGYTGYSKML